MLNRVALTVRTFAQSTSIAHCVTSTANTGRTSVSFGGNSALNLRTKLETWHISNTPCDRLTTTYDFHWNKQRHTQTTDNDYGDTFCILVLTLMNTLRSFASGPTRNHKSQNNEPAPLQTLVDAISCYRNFVRLTTLRKQARVLTNRTSWYLPRQLVALASTIVCHACRATTFRMNNRDCVGRALHSMITYMNKRVLERA